MSIWIVLGCIGDWFYWSESVRWGLLDFIRAVLLLLLFLLLRLRVLCVVVLLCAIVFASCMLQAADRSVWRRTSPGELPSGAYSAGPHPGSSRAERTALDLSCQKKYAENMSDKNVKRYVRKNVGKTVRRYMKIRQKRMSEDMPERLSIEMSEDM